MPETTQPRERGILMCGEMVRALLAGRKTQTRRIARDFNETEGVKLGFGNDCAKQFPPRFEDGKWKAARVGYECDCPYGKPGDRLYVKETFFDVRPWKSAPIFAATAVDFIYRADYEYREKRTGESSKIIGCHPWKPSIFMPREASRILLEATQVRVQRVQDSSAEDAIAEGIPTAKGSGPIDGETCYKMTTNTGYMRGPAGAILAYRDLWNSINLDPKPVCERNAAGKRVIVRYEAFPWCAEDFYGRHPAVQESIENRGMFSYRGIPLSIFANPWVWAVTFKRIQP